MEAIRAAGQQAAGGYPAAPAHGPIAAGVDMPQEGAQRERSPAERSPSTTSMWCEMIYERNECTWADIRRLLVQIRSVRLRCAESGRPMCLNQ